VRSTLPQLAPHLRLGWQWPQALRSLRHRNFRLFFFGQLISLTGSWMQTTAQQWLVYRITASQLSLGTVTFINFLPVLLLSLFMGVLVDRFPRRTLLVFTQTGFTLLAAILALLTWTGVVEYWHILVLAGLFGIANALDMPARQAFFSDMVPRDELFNAIALNSSVFNGARILGPAIGGFVVAAFGEAPAFGLNAASYLAVIGALLMMRLPPRSEPADRQRGLGQLRQGLRYLASDRRLLGLVTMIALFSLVGFPFTVLMPVFASDILGIGASGLGGLLAAMGVGALAAALSLAVLGDRQTKGPLLFVMRLLFAGALAGFSLSQSVFLSMTMLAVAGFALITQLAVTNTLIQLIVADGLRGRVLSAYTWALGGFWPLGSLLIGWGGDQLGAPTVVLLSAIGSAVLAVLGRVWFPAERLLT
jgi:MFS family permease